MSDNIKVVVKVRPLISREIEDKLSYQWRVKNNTLYQLDQNGKDLGQSFTFDRVYDKDTKTSDVYDDIAKPIVQAATAGFNGTIFAYGQTSSGKTYTMTGTDGSPGIIPLAVLNLFEIIRNVPDRDFLVRVSYIEIYNETVKDLLNVDKENIKIQETHQGIKVDATERVTSSPEEVLASMKEGEANRQKGATYMNEQSSRSHSIFQIIIESREHIEGEEEVGCVNVSQLNLVDLAGSERSGQTGATGLRFKEGTHINKSLSALALVIKQLSEDPNKHANYRDSKLTRILQNSLGGNAKTSIICAITPACVDETISTLQFANRAKAIKNKPEVNAVATDATMIQRLTKQMCKLQAQLESKKNIEQDNYKLQSKIANLKKLILNGFAQRRSEGLMSGARRKLQQPRRITISTLPSIENDPVVNIPKFCTPSLKYNPMSIPTPGDSLPGSKLPSVPEEPRLATPPPARAVGFSDEVIELDSDDDDSAREDVQTCSPIHKCYGATKTPPCILRRNAKLAEKNLQDIVELTEREKMYTPSVVEYIEKLEQNTTIIAKLKDEIEILCKHSKEKDLEMDHLKNMVKRTEEDMKSLTLAKIELLTQCDNYSTRLTDAEVSYETLRNKARLREEELLSLLEELTARNKKPDDIGKIMSRTLDKEMHFMDMSRDISLVNSDNESSVVATNDDEPEVINDLVTDAQTQLNIRNQKIIDLEANIFTHQQNISSLESLNRDLQEQVTTFKDKLAFMENENSILKTTIDNLNLTIKGQKENLETANNDIDSYNSLIQELQIKITQKERLPHININDSVLENMIANEEKFIANNENMKNIIQSLKMALDTRNKEIDQLKTTLLESKNLTLNNKTLTEQLESQLKEVDKLNAEVDTLKKQIKENIAIISKLMHENKDLKVIEHELSGKLASFQEKNEELEKCYNENVISLKQMTEENHKLILTIADKNNTEQVISDINKQLLKKVEDLTQKNADLEKDEKQSKECLQNAKTAVLKTQLILGTLSGNIQEVPEIIDNFVNIFKFLNDSMNSLEIVANDIVRQKEEAIKNKSELETVLEELTFKHNSEISALQEQIKSICTTESQSIEETETLTQKNYLLKNELQMTRDELDTKISENKTLQVNLNQAMENIESCNQIITALNTKIVNSDQALIDRKNVTENLTTRLEEIQNTLKNKISEINIIEERLYNSQQEREELLNCIFKKVKGFTSNFNIQDDGGEQNVCGEIQQRILLTLEQIGNHITFISLKNVDDDNRKDSEILLEAKKKIVDLTQRNLNLEEKLSEIENINSELSFELNKIQDDNNILNEELFASQDILQNLQKDLKLKAIELGDMEVNVRDWKEQFISLDHIMKQQMCELKSENVYLKSRIADFRHEPEPKSIVTYEHKDSYDINNREVTLEQKLSDVSTNDGASSPPSLLTICCNKIIDSIQPKEADLKTTTSSSAEVSVQSDEIYLVKCKCNQLSTELKEAREENSRIIDLLQQMETINQHLIQEQEAVRSEIQLLAAPAQELQKKIMNHKTNLAILTATTYAENRSLKSQVKVLQHHHSRYHNVCQRDIPDFKKQLTELMTLLGKDLSNADQQNTSFKRYSLPDVLDSSTTVPNFKNESTLDGDLLMLDTNITITTAADNTLIGQDQTCLDLTQFCNEASSEINELNQIIDHKTKETEIYSLDNHNINERLNMLNDENIKLRQVLQKYTETKQCMTDTQSSPIKTNNYGKDDIIDFYGCDNCKTKDEVQQAQEKLNDELKIMSLELTDIKSQKAEIEDKYNNLLLEMPSTDMLVKKLNNLEKDYNTKLREIDKLSDRLSMKTQEFKRLQDENDTLSTQVMENISEADYLNKELENVKKVNSELLEKCSKLEQSVKIEVNDKPKSEVISCSDCVAKDELIKTMQKRLTTTHTRLNRSLSDTDTTSRYNKICTLQSELHAGREDCKELTEDVITIKNHLERSNLSMDLDDSMGESNTYTFSKEFGISSPQSNKCNMPDIPEERTADDYIIDKLDCFNYYIEKTGKEKDTINRDVKIIELMKMFYEYLITQHGTEVANMTNKLKEYDESKCQLEIQICHLIEKNSQVTMELKQKELNYNSVSHGLSKIKDNINILNQELICVTDIDVTKLVNMYKNQFFKVLDSELGLSSVNIFKSVIDNIVNKHQTDLIDITDRYNKLQEHLESVTKECYSVNENLALMRSQLTSKENEYNQLLKQKERIHEISNAVTLDLVKKDNALIETISDGYKKLKELNVIDNQNIDLTLPINKNVSLLFEHLINQHKNVVNQNLEKEKETFALEVKKSKEIIEEKEKEIELLQTRDKYLKEINSNFTITLVDKENELQAQKALHEDLVKIYERKVEENKANVDLIEKLSEEIKLLKATIEDKETTIESLEMKMNMGNKFNENDVKITELIETVKGLQDDVTHLKAMNAVIVKEKDAYAIELLKSGETIKRNNMEMDKMTSDILILRESVRENGIVIENLNIEAKKLLKHNMELKEQLEEKCKECYRLETNIKTHEKTAEVQTRMITRLQTQRKEDEQMMSEKVKQIEELSQKCVTLQNQSGTRNTGNKDKDELELLRKTKETLEARVSELESLLEEQKTRLSMDAIADSSRRRRQSLHDSKRLFAGDNHDFPDHNNLEAVFESRPKPDDLFMDVDDDISNRSTPIRLSKGRDSLSLSRTDQSDKDEEHPSRPSSVVATRRRRQSIHDLHRSVLRHTPSPHGLDTSNRIIDEFNHSKPPDAVACNDSELSQLRENLASCQQELEDLKEKYRELDEECETCAEYLRERDEQCIRLKKEKTTLQATITELKEQLHTPNLSQHNASKPTVAHVAVNTDEDWTNLHSVVVDRMSFDAEVEKNKRLTKTIEELRFKKQDMKNTLAKMQKALERNNGSRELESTKHELQACKQELLQLRERYKELDEECETCAQYLRDREEQCRRLKEAKSQLEAKLQEFQSDVNVMALSTRKKRQSLHDQNRSATVAVTDASTETSEDFLSYQVERDGSFRPSSEDIHTKEMQRLKSVVEKLSHQKAMLEQQLVNVSAAMHAPHPMYVATGSAIVQNQQLTDVMKENQKLKKMNAKLVNICKKRGKDSNRENEDPANQG